MEGDNSKININNKKRGNIFKQNIPLSEFYSNVQYQSDQEMKEEDEEEEIINKKITKRFKNIPKIKISSEIIKNDDEINQNFKEKSFISNAKSVITFRKHLVSKAF